MDAHALNIVDDMMSSNVLAANSMTTYACYIRVTKINIKNEEALPPAVGHGMGAPVVKMLGITLFMTEVLTYPLRRTTLFMIQATDEFSKTDHKWAFIYASVFYRHVRALLDELHVRQIEPGCEKLQILAPFFHMKIQQTRNVTHKIMSRFITTTCPFVYDGSHKLKK